MERIIYIIILVGAGALLGHYHWRDHKKLASEMRRTFRVRFVPSNKNSSKGEKNAEKG